VRAEAQELLVVNELLAVEPLVTVDHRLELTRFRGHPISLERGVLNRPGISGDSIT
jgi:hypothetical protein